jgi:hypothetical protein
MGQRAKGKGQRAKGKGQNAKGKGQRAKCKIERMSIKNSPFEGGQGDVKTLFQNLNYNKST